MLRKDLQYALCIAALCLCEALIAPAQTQLPLVQEIKLPVRPHLGTLGGGFLAIGWSSSELFQFKIAPDQSLVVLYPNTSDKWPLVRVRNWWTKAPEIEELDLPGWSEANTRYETSIGTDLLITPDGNYALALGSVASVKDARNIPFPPSELIEHKPDLLITVIDLHLWKIIGALHTATVDPNAEFRGAYIVNGKWLALQGIDTEPERVKYEHLYDRVNRLIAIPDLKPGPGCMSQDSEILALALGAPKGGAGGLSDRTDASCAGLLDTANVPSMRVLDWLIYLAHDPEPRKLMAHTQFSQLDGSPQNSGPSALPDLIWPTGEYNHGYWTSIEWNIFEDNPPFESSVGNWYQLHGQDPGANYHYQLSKYTHAGKLLKTSATDLQSEPLCRSRFACACEVVDVSEQQNAVLALCRAQSVNFTGSFDWHRQWLSLFRADDLSRVGDAALTTNFIRAAIALAAGHTWVVTVEEGKTVRVYAVPDH